MFAISQLRVAWIVPERTVFQSLSRKLFKFVDFFLNISSQSDCFVRLVFSLASFRIKEFWFCPTTKNVHFVGLKYKAKRHFMAVPKLPLKLCQFFVCEDVLCVVEHIRLWDARATGFRKSSKKYMACAVAAGTIQRCGFFNFKPFGPMFASAGHTNKSAAAFICARHFQPCELLLVCYRHFTVFYNTRQDLSHVIDFCFTG